MQHGYTNYIMYLFQKITHATELKWIAGVFVAITSFLFDPVHIIAHFSLFVLICLDFAFGIAASRYDGEPVRSSKVIRTAIKMVVYFTLIAAARITEHTLPLNLLDETVTGFLAATELLSILENTGRMGFAVPSKLVALLGDYVSGKNADKKAQAEELKKKRDKK